MLLRTPRRAVPVAPAAGWLARATLGAGLVAGAWYGLRHPVVQRADVRVGDAIREISSPVLDRVVTATTDLGSVYAVVGIGGTLSALGRRRAAADVLAVGGVAWSVAQSSKRMVRRERPYEAHGVRRLIRPPTGSSFPSGHAAVGAAVMTVLADRASGRGAAGLLRALGAYVAATRIYAGVHYPTDVVGGAGLGLLIGSAWRGPVAWLSGRVVGGAGRGLVVGGGAVRRLARRRSAS